MLSAALANEQASVTLHDACMQGADPPVVRLTAYVVVFLAVYLVLFYATRMIYQGIEAVQLQPFDRLLGAALGLGKAALLLAAAAWALNAFQHPKTKELMSESTLAPVFVEGMESVLNVIPPEVKTEVCEGVQSLKNVAAARRIDEIPGL